jgi:branched chain amino acid efflux pump
MGSARSVRDLSVSFRHGGEMSNQRREFARGIRAQAPLLLGVAPFGMAYGAYAVKSGLSVGLAQAMSVIVFGGASQFVAVRLIVRSVPDAIIVLAVLLVNLRHILYSASLAPYLDRLPKRWRWALAYVLTDEAYATAIARYRQPDASPDKHWFLLGSGTALWVTWQLTTAMGVFVGAAVPDSWSLDFALPLTLLAILVPALKDRPSLAAAMIAGAIALAGFRWPYGTGLLMAMLFGMAAGMASESLIGGGDGAVEAA